MVTCTCFALSEMSIYGLLHLKEELDSVVFSAHGVAVMPTGGRPFLLECARAWGLWSASWLGTQSSRPMNAVYTRVQYEELGKVSRRVAMRTLLHPAATVPAA